MSPCLQAKFDLLIMELVSPPMLYMLVDWTFFHLTPKSAESALMLSSPSLYAEWATLSSLQFCL